MSSVRMPSRELALLREASAREEISQSEFFRRAIRERVAAVLKTARASIERSEDGVVDE